MSVKSQNLKFLLFPKRNAGLPKMKYMQGMEEHDKEGRVITLEYDNFYLVTCYTPNSQNELARLPYRMTWEDDFLAYLKKLDAVKPVILCGDLNVAHEEIDLKNPKTNHKNAGFSDEERAKMTEEKLSQISLTDSDSKLMKMNEGFGVCYNTQIAFTTMWSPPTSAEYFAIRLKNFRREKGRYCPCASVYTARMR